MATCFTKLLRDESGLVITAELIMIITIAVISLAAGWGAVSQMLASELADVANSVGSLDQSFNYRGITAVGHASCSGGGFNDSSNSVTVTTDSSFNASVAGLDFDFLIPDLPEVAPAALAGEPFVLVEESFGVDAQISEVELLALAQLDIVSIREDGSVILLREDLVEVQTDGSILILDDELRQESLSIQQSLRVQQGQSNGRIRAQGTLIDDGEASAKGDLSSVQSARKEIEQLRQEINAAQSGSNSNELQQENARLRELIEKLCRESQTR